MYLESVTTKTSDAQKIAIPFFSSSLVFQTISRLLFSSAEMVKKPLWQTVSIQIRLLI